MKIKFTGTGDGRGIPSVGCKCQRCSLTREKGGKNDFHSRFDKRRFQ